MREGEAVDGAVGVRRHIELGDDIAREDAPGRLRQRYRLFVNHGRDPRLDQRERRVDAEQCAAEGKAIIAQLRHDPNPRWSAMNAATAPASPSGKSGIGAASTSSEAIATTCGSSG